MRNARDSAWELAQKLAPLGRDEQLLEIARRDQVIAGLARVVRTPGILGSLIALVIRFRESSNVRRVIYVLGSGG